MKEYIYGERKGILNDRYENICKINKLNEKRNGIGKSYYLTGHLEYEGEYLNGKKMEKKRIF